MEGRLQQEATRAIAPLYSKMNARLYIFSHGPRGKQELKTQLFCAMPPDIQLLTDICLMQQRLPLLLLQALKRK